MKVKTATVKLSEEEEKILDMKAAEVGMTRSEYIRKSIFGDKIQVISKKEEFYKSLCAIDAAVREAERRPEKKELSKIREAVFEACQKLY